MSHGFVVSENLRPRVTLPGSWEQHPRWRRLNHQSTLAWDLANAMMNSTPQTGLKSRIAPSKERLTTRLTRTRNPSLPSTFGPLKVSFYES